MTGILGRRIGWFVACLALVACAAKTHAPVDHQVEIRGMQYVPSELVLAVGDTVSWTNRDVVPHTVTALGTFDSGSLSSQQQWRYTATAAGQIAYGCTFHPPMRGSLIVR